MLEESFDQLEAAQTARDSAGLLSDIAFIYKMQGKLEYATETIDKAISISERTSNDTLLLKVLGAAASIYGVNGKNEKSIQLFRSTLKLAQQLGDSIMIRSSFYELAMNMVDYGTVNSALDTIQIALRLYEQSGELKKQGLCYNSIAAIYSQLGDYEQSLYYHTKAIEKFEDVQKSRGFPNVLCGKAQSLALLGRSEEAETTLQEALLYTRQNHFEPEEAHVLVEMGNQQLNRNEIASAQSYLDSALTIYNSLGMKSALPEVFLNMSKVQSALSNYATSLSLAKEGLAQAENMQQAAIKSQLWKQVYLMEAALNQPSEALAARLKYDSLKSELVLQQELRQSRNLEALFRNAEQKKELLLKDQELLEKGQSLERSRFKSALAWTSFGGLALIGLFGLFGFKLRLRNQEQKNRLALNQALIESTDNERERIAQELHDGTGSLLTGTKLGLEHLKDSLPSPEMQAKLEQNISQIQAVAQEIRRVAHAMAPAAIDRLSFVDVLEDLIQTFQANEKADIQSSVAGNLDLLNKTERLMLYRILQECLNNSFKHADATEIHISISVEGREAELLYQDNGKGYDLNHTSTGIGLKGIEQRIQYLNGKKMLETEKGSGMLLVVNFPVLTS